MFHILNFEIKLFVHIELVQSEELLLAHTSRKKAPPATFYALANRAMIITRGRHQVKKVLFCTGRDLTF